ncbi:MAG: J domain-containing protein [Dehalococcoidia bacterium]|nr:J domain-containing protein [Dehalococcoidia bacterium]
MQTDPYQTLGIKRTSSEKEIRTAYRKLAREYHPDVNAGDSAAAEKFKTINDAYQILSDSEKKAQYDRFGHARPAGGSGFQNDNVVFDFGDVFGGRGSQSSGFESLFGGLGGAFNRKPQPQKGSDTEQQIEISLEDSYKGIAKTVTAQVGKYPGSQIEVKIPAGVKNKQRIRIPRRGQDGRNGGNPGDLYIKTMVMHHPIFTRTNDDLEIDLLITPSDAALGSSLSVTSIKSTTLEVSIPASSQGGAKIRLAGQGMPKTDGGFGDLIGIIRIRVPNELSEAQKALYEQLRALEESGQEA